ncbi:MAG: CapA family protein [Acidobacteriota bacterium]
MSLIFTGDVYPGTDPSKILGAGLEALPACEFLVANLECVLAPQEGGEIRDDKSAILVTTEMALEALLEAARVPAVLTLGNNHIHDLGVEGIAATLKGLNRRGVRHAGVGLPREVSRPCVVSDGSATVALLPVSTDEPEVMSRRASTGEPGVLDYYDRDIHSIISESKRRRHFVVVLPHWGREHLDYPAVALRRRAYSWIDSGADLVVGHHPHRVQGKELYKGKWIYYSLGNFLFPNFFTKEGHRRRWQKASNRSIVLRVRFAQGLQIEEHGFTFDPGRFILRSSPEGVSELHEKSRLLDVTRVSHKRYFPLWERHYITVIRRQRAPLRRIRESVFPQHREHGTVRFFARRLVSRIGRMLNARG